MILQQIDDAKLRQKKMPNAQRAVWQDGGLVSSEILFNFASV